MNIPMCFIAFKGQISRINVVPTRREERPPDKADYSILHRQIDNRSMASFTPTLQIETSIKGADRGKEMKNI